MKKITRIMLSIVLFLLVGCAPSLTTLYYWDDFSYMYYNLKKNHTPEDIVKFKESIQKIINNSKNYNRKVPPGIYAEYGYLLIQEGNKSEGIKYLELEAKTYPESAKLMKRIENNLKK